MTHHENDFARTCDFARYSIKQLIEGDVLHLFYFIAPESMKSVQMVFLSLTEKLTHHYV